MMDSSGIRYAGSMVSSNVPYLYQFTAYFICGSEPVCRKFFLLQFLFFGSVFPRRLLFQRNFVLKVFVEVTISTGWFWYICHAFDGYYMWYSVSTDRQYLLFYSADSEGSHCSEL